MNKSSKAITMLILLGIIMGYLTDVSMSDKDVRLAKDGVSVRVSITRKNPYAKLFAEVVDFLRKSGYVERNNIQPRIVVRVVLAKNPLYNNYDVTTVTCSEGKSDEWLKKNSTNELTSVIVTIKSCMDGLETIAEYNKTVIHAKRNVSF